MNNQPNNQNTQTIKVSFDSDMILSVKRSFRDDHTIHGLWYPVSNPNKIAKPTEEELTSLLNTFKQNNYHDNQRLLSHLSAVWSHDWKDEDEKLINHPEVIQRLNLTLWHHEYLKHGFASDVVSYFTKALDYYYKFLPQIKSFDPVDFNDKEIHFSYLKDYYQGMLVVANNHHRSSFHSFIASNAPTPQEIVEHKV